jgi:hypothetical protein
LLGGLFGAALVRRRDNLQMKPPNVRKSFSAIITSRFDCGGKGALMASRTS